MRLVMVSRIGYQITTCFQRSTMIMSRINVLVSIACLSWSHNSTCSVYFESAHRDSNWPPYM